MINLLSKRSIWLPMAIALAANVVTSVAAQAQHRGGAYRAQLGKFALHKVDQRQRSGRQQRSEKRGHVEPRQRSRQRHRSENRRHVEHRQNTGKRYRSKNRRYVEHRQHYKGRDRRYRAPKNAHRNYAKRYGHRRPVKKIVVVEPRRRYRKVWVHRRYGHRYRGYGHYHRDDNAYQWLAFTAITLGVLDYMTAAQQRAHESAQITATSAPIGQSIRWNDGGLKGNVTATREGTSSSGRYCREFRQAVTVGGKVDETYGTACRQPDGAWEIIP